MKKQNNIFAYAKQTFSLILAILFCISCTDETYQDENQVEEGIPVEVDFNFQTSNIDKVNTRLSDAGEFQVNDLYLLIFDSNGSIKNRYYYDGDALTHTNGNQQNPTKGTITGIRTTSGKSYIYGIANVGDNELDRKGELKSKLDRVNSVSDLKDLTTTLNNDGNIARSSASLLMSGKFQATGASTSDKEEGICNIPTTNKALSGTLLLRRSDSHITFNIKLGEKIESFELKSWQVFNVPISSYLIDQSKQYVASEYKDSELQATYNNEGKLYAFNFYMQENLKEAIMEARDHTTLTAYKDREKEYKNPDGTNTGEYKFVENNATYVEIKVRMNIETESEDGIRTADVRYIIHLGGGANEFTNFKSERNKKYIYNVTINDVESIIVEVEDGEDDPNARPGVEGDVVDATTSVYTLDAHYNCFNIGFTYEDVVENLSFIIQSPFAADAVYSVKGKIGALDNTPQENGDYKWIQLQRTTGEKVLSQYNSGKENRPFNLYQLVDDMKDRGKPNDGKTYYYTIFINEYYYTEAPAKANWPDKNHLWRYFVNQDDRKLMLFLSPKNSADKESSYSKASHMFSGRSIQTYYSTEVLNNNGNALGMEHVNETGAPDWGNGNSSDRGNGFLNTYKYFFTTTSFRNRTWEYFVNYSISDDYKYTYKMKDVAAIAECLSRNRDENGNGRIDLDELKWYLPATDQLVSMFLGAKSLPSPLFDARSISSVTYDDGNNHYITSNKQKIWAEEGCSFGEIGGGYAEPKLLRCVRNLGLSNQDAEKEVVSPAYTYQSSNRVFIMDQLTIQNKRSGKTTGELDFHDNFNDINRPYKAFQMANSFIGKENTNWKTFFDIGENHLTKCKDLNEGGHKWRAPNQREFMIMFLQNANNVINGNYRGFTRTHWKYDKDRHFGCNGSLLFLDGNKGVKDYDRTIRCVRDVDVDTNGNIIND